MIEGQKEYGVTPRHVAIIVIADTKINKSINYQNIEFRVDLICQITGITQKQPIRKGKCRPKIDGTNPWL